MRSVVAALLLAAAIPSTTSAQDADSLVERRIRNVLGGLLIETAENGVLGPGWRCGRA